MKQSSLVIALVFCLPATSFTAMITTSNKKDLSKSSLQQFFYLLMEADGRNGSTKSLDKDVPLSAFNFPFQARHFERLRADMTQEQILYHHLFRRYDRFVRPVGDVNEPVIVHVGMTLAQISDIDMKEQKMVALFWQDQEWLDHRLTWNSAEFYGIENIRIPYHKVWTPDIVLYNDVGKYRPKDTPIDNLATVGANGTVFLAPVFMYHSYCRLDVTFFPFDYQICWLKLGSWMHTGDVLDVHIRGNGIDTSNHLGNGEWELIGHKTVKHVKFYPCCPEPFPEIYFYFHLKRRLLYYTFSVLAPCIIMSSVAMFTFFLPTECSEKVTLGLTVLLAYTVFQLTTTESLPKTSEFVAYISIYFTVVILTISMTVFTSIIVVSAKEMGRMTGKCPPRLLLKGFAFFNMIPLELIESTTLFTAAKKKRKLLKKCFGCYGGQLVPHLQKAVVLKRKPVVFEFQIRDDLNLLGQTHSRLCRLVPNGGPDIFRNEASLMDMDLNPTREAIFDSFIKGNSTHSRCKVEAVPKHLTEIVLENKSILSSGGDGGPKIRLIPTDCGKLKVIGMEKECDDGDSDYEALKGIKGKALRKEAARAAEEIRVGVEKELNERQIDREWVAVYMALDTFFFVLLTLIHMANTLGFILILPLMVPNHTLNYLVDEHLRSMNSSLNESISI